MRRPKQVRSEESARSAIDAVLGLISERGLASVSIAAVAERSGVSNGSIYHRFGSRDGLIAAAQQQYLDELDLAYVELLDEVRALNDEREAVRFLAERVLSVFSERREVLRAFIIESPGSPQLVARGYDSTRTFMERTADFLVERFSRVERSRAHAFAVLLRAIAFSQITFDDAVETEHELANMLVRLLGE